MGSRGWWWPGAIICTLVLGVSLVQPSCALHRDIRFEAVRSLFDTSRTYMGDPGPAIVAATRLARDGRAAIYDRYAPIGSSFIYPPLAAALYRPLADLPADQAHDRLATADGVLFLGIIALMVWLASTRRGLTGWLVPGCVLAAIAFYPLDHAMQLNQATLLVTVCIGAAWLALESDRQALAGVLFALTLAVKPQLVLVLPAMIWGARRMVVASLVTCAALLVASIAYAGVTNHVDYVMRVLPSLSRGYPYYANQGINGLLYRAVSGENLAVFEQSADSAFVRWGTRFAAVGALVAVVLLARRWSARGVPPVWTFALAWLSATMTSPVAWQHHYAPALFVFVTVASAIREVEHLRRPAVGVLMGTAFGLMAAYFEVRAVQGVAARMLVSYVLYGAIALFAALVLVGESLPTSTAATAPACRRSPPPPARRG
jgi:hypothetical protein